MCHDALLVARGVDLECSPAVQPYTAAALPGIAFAADRGMIETIKLLIFYVGAVLQVADRFASVEIERRADVKLTVRSERNALMSGVAVVHIVEEYSVSQKVEV